MCACSPTNLADAYCGHKTCVDPETKKRKAATPVPPPAPIPPAQNRALHRAHFGFDLGQLIALVESHRRASGVMSSNGRPQAAAHHQRIAYLTNHAAKLLAEAMHLAANPPNESRGARGHASPAKDHEPA